MFGSQAILSLPHTKSVVHPGGALSGVCVPNIPKQAKMFALPSTESKAVVTAPSDEELIARARDGDATAFESLVNRYRKPAMRVALRFTGRETEAEELTQDAFLQLHCQAHKYDPAIAPFSAWFFTILCNLCRNAVRRGKSRSFIDLPASASVINDPENDFARKERRSALIAALARLTPKQRAVLILRHGEDFSCAKTAEALGLSVKAVGALSVRARRSLLRELTEFGKKSFA
jgi:RNA polymerase sigma-70 factor (ECF subfamily)